MMKNNLKIFIYLKDLIAENERLRNSIIEKDNLLKQKDEIIKNMEKKVYRQPKNKKPVCC